MSREDLRSLVLEISQDIDSRTNLLVALDEICGYEAEDAAWLAAALAERSLDHADQVVDVVVRMSNEVERMRTDRRVGRRVATLAAAHSPGSGESRLDEIRAYCLSLTDPTRIEDLAVRLERLQLNRPPLPVSRTAQGLAAAAVRLARGGERSSVLAAIVENDHLDLLVAIKDLDDEHAPPPGWEERVWERVRQERRGWLGRLWDRFTGR